MKIKLNHHKQEIVKEFTKEELVKLFGEGGYTTLLNGGTICWKGIRFNRVNDEVKK